MHVHASYGRSFLLRCAPAQADPKGAEEQRRAEAAAAELADAAARVGGAGGGRGRSPSPSRQAGSSAAYGRLRQRSSRA